ncbi:MAG TPA: endonuclease III [Terriglobales bacterium]|nr:endonuclease III [Terriglobales bacterium]
MPRGTGPRQPRWAKQGYRITRPPARAKVQPRPAPRPAARAAKGPAKSTNARYNPTGRARVAEIIRRLDATYPGVTCALQHRNSWELLVATILSAQCTDERVNKTTPELFAKYPTVQDFARLQPEQLEPDIRSTGFFRNKSKSLVGAAKKLVAEFNGEVPQTMEELLTLPGVARKTANVLLGTWFRKNIGVVVDTHVTRISRRLELTKNDDPGKIEQDLMRVIPQERWTDFSHQVIHHGRKFCIARKPKCAECPLEDLCHAADKTWSTVEIHKSARP